MRPSTSWPDGTEAHPLLPDPDDDVVAALFRIALLRAAPLFDELAAQHQLSVLERNVLALVAAPALREDCADFYDMLGGELDTPGITRILGYDTDDEPAVAAALVRIAPLLDLV